MTNIAAADAGPDRRRDNIIPLTSIRGIAAIWVVIYHFVSTPVIRGVLDQLPLVLKNAVFGGGTVAVDIFFLLSGYILADRYGRASDTTTFFAHRAARVLPLHFAVLGAMALGVAAAEAAGARPDNPSAFSWETLPLHIALVNVWFHVQGWNQPTWSLNAEAIAYAVFPVLQWARRRSAGRTVAVAAIFFLAADISMLHVTGFEATGLVAIGRGLLGFGTGVMARFALGQRSLSPATAPVCVLAIAGLSCLGWHDLALLPSAGLILALGAGDPSVVYRAMSAKPFERLGQISFSVYLVHMPILIPFTQLLKRLPALHASAVMTGFWAAAYLCTTLVVAHLTWRHIEVPARGILRLKLTQRQARAAAGDNAIGRAEPERLPAA